MNDSHETSPDAQAVLQVMERSMDDVHAPADRLASAAMTRGRALRRRRRAASLVVSVAAASIVGVALPRLAGDGTQADGIGPSSNPTVVDSGGPTPVDPDATGWWDMPAPEMRDRLAGLLPDDVRITSAETWNNDRAPGEKSAPMQGYVVAYVTNDRVGPGGLNLVFYPNVAASTADVPEGQDLGGEPTVADHLTCPGNLDTYDTCRELRRDDGTVYARESTWNAGGVIVYGVDIQTTGGHVVTLDAANSTDDKWGWGSTVSADEPPLTIEQMLAIAEDPTWQDWDPPRE